MKTLLIVYDEANNALSIQNSPGVDGYVCAFELTPNNEADKQVYEYLLPKFLAVYEQADRSEDARGTLIKKEVSPERLVELKEKRTNGN